MSLLIHILLAVFLGQTPPGGVEGANYATSASGLSTSSRTSTAQLDTSTSHRLERIEAEQEDENEEEDDDGSRGRTSIQLEQPGGTACGLLRIEHLEGLRDARPRTRAPPLS